MSSEHKFQKTSKNRVHDNQNENTLQLGQSESGIVPLKAFVNAMISGLTEIKNTKNENVSLPFV